jgi:hypothetical protein
LIALTKITPMFLAAFALSACGFGSMRPAYLVNESQHPLSVTLSFPKPVSVSGEPPTCRLRPNVRPLLTGKIEHAMRNEVRGWRRVEYVSFDAEICEASFVVHPGMAVFVFWAHANPDEQRANGIGRLSISDETGRSLNLSGREAEAAFKASWRDNRQLRF